MIFFLADFLKLSWLLDSKEQEADRKRPPSKKRWPELELLREVKEELKKVVKI